MSTLLRLFSVVLPWPLRRWVLTRCFGYELHPTSRIGLSWVFPSHLELGADTRIGHLTVAKNLDLIRLGEFSSIGNGNWITGFPLGPSVHFAQETGRAPELVIGRHSAITNRHLIDCTSRVTIGDFTTFAGFASQVLTHSIDLAASRQASSPVTIGDYCFVGTNCVILGGARLPDRSVLGAKSLLNKAFEEPQRLYAGAPAQMLKALPDDTAYFHRPVGMVH